MINHSIKISGFIICAALVFHVLITPISSSEQIHDQYSRKRDKILASQVIFKDNKTITFKRILVRLEPNENQYSIRNGREVLALFRDDFLVQQLDEIDGFSNLFLDKATFDFKDLNLDGYKDLIIQIKAHESLPYIWIYRNNGNILTFIKTLQCNDYELLNNHIKIEYSVYNSWNESYTSFGVNDLPELRRYDFYQMKESSLVNVNIEYSEFFRVLVKDYLHRIEILQQRKSAAKSQYLSFNLSKQISKIEAIINEYQQINSKQGK